MDPNDHMNPEITTEEYPAIVATYQQWLANRDSRISILEIKLAKAHGRLQLTQQDLETRTQERDTLSASVTSLQELLTEKQDSEGVIVLDAPDFEKDDDLLPE